MGVKKAQVANDAHMPTGSLLRTGFNPTTVQLAVDLGTTGNGDFRAVRFHSTDHTRAERLIKFKLTLRCNRTRYANRKGCDKKNKNYICIIF